MTNLIVKAIGMVSLCAVLAVSGTAAQAQPPHPIQHDVRALHRESRTETRLRRAHRRQVRHGRYGAAANTRLRAARVRSRIRAQHHDLRSRRGH